jgi:hypothetical protein
MDTRRTFRDYRGSIKTDGGTRPVCPVAQWFQYRVKGGWDWKIRPAVRQENPLRRVVVPVPQTDTGGRDEYSKALG